MIRFLAFISMVLISLSAAAQFELKDLRGEAQKPKDCDEVALAALRDIPDLYYSKQIDSLYSRYEQWSQYCAQDEPQYRLNLLFEIEDRVFDETKVDGLFLALEDYQSNCDRYNTIDPRYDSYSEWIRPFKKYNAFTVVYAQHLLDSITDLSDLEQRLLEFYTHKQGLLLKDLKNQRFETKRIQESYNLGKNQWLMAPRFEAGLFAGAWLPQQKSLGNHPMLGALVGGGFKRYTVHIAFSAAFMALPDSIKIREQDSVFYNDYFHGIYFGVEGGYNLIHTRRNRLALLAGIAYEGLTFLPADPEVESSTEVARRTLNLNSGIGYRFFYDNNSYLELQGRYNFANFKNPGGTNISTNPITIRLIWGFSEVDAYKKPEMGAYDYLMQYE